MLEKQLEALKKHQVKISDICDEIHNTLTKSFNANYKMLIRYEPSFDEAKLNITIVYFNRNIAVYIYDINNNKIGARTADYNPIDTNGNKCRPKEMLEHFEKQINDKMNTEVFLIARNWDAYGFNK